MSDLSIFRIVFILPKALGELVRQLHGSMKSELTIQGKQLRWHTCGERELELNRVYHEILTQTTHLNRKESLPKPIISLNQQHTHLKSMVTALKQLPVMAHTLETRPQWKECQQAIRTIGKAAANQRITNEICDLVHQTDSSIRLLTLNAHRRLAQVEQNVVGSLTVDTLQTMGYRLKARGHNLLGSAGKTNLRAKVELGGRIMMDTTAFSGMDCHREVARIEHALKERGLVLQRVGGDSRIRHQGVLLLDPFPKMDHSTDPVTTQNETLAMFQGNGSQWQTSQRQYHQQRLKLKEG
ncbi:uncharacterized protein Dvar_51430 [Desulfosarcina variabilis str. Montpellier]|uniref:hypothetical protein n=1 Tax=Desulfosarcina variabilis TaxID=2300 RepID=UPI003AFA4685